MRTYRDIDYNTRINGSLLVGLSSTFSNDLTVLGLLAAGDIVDVNKAIKSKFNNTGGAISGNVTIGGNLTVTGNIIGVDLTQYYTKINLQTSAQALVHWGNLTYVPVASTAASGIVRLNNTVNSTLATQAATAGAVKTAYDLANSKWAYDENTIKTVKVNVASNADTVNNLIVLTAVPAGAIFTDTIYKHPSDHPASMIVESALRRFVSDTEKGNWDAKASTNVATETSNGLMSNLSYTKLLNIDEYANNYVHPESHPIDMITDSSSYIRMTPTERTVIGSLGENYYSKINLESSGQSSIHWDNLVNIPTYDNYAKWVLKVNSEAIGYNISSSSIVDVKGSGATTVSRTKGVITISSVNTNTTYLAGSGLNLTTGSFSIKLGATPGLTLDGNGLVNSDKGSSQNIFKTITGNIGSAVASTNSDSFQIKGSGAINTSITGKALIINHTDTDHTTFPILAGANTFTGSNKITSELILQPDSAPVDVTARQSKVFSNNQVTLGTPVDALTEIVYKASTGTGVWTRDIDYTIDYKTGTIERKTDGGISANATIYVIYTPTVFLLKIKGSAADNTDYLQIDNKGNIYGKSMTVNLTSSQSSTSNDVQGNFIIQGNLNVNGQTTLGNDNADLTTINGKLSLYNTGVEKFAIDNIGTMTAGTVPWARLSYVPDGTLSTKGIVQLSNSVSSTSTTIAATSSSVKAAYDLASTKWLYNEATIKAIKINNSVNADNANTVNGLTVLTEVPLNAIFTDTVYAHPNHTGDVTSAADGATIIGANKVTNAMLSKSAALSVIGNATNVSANVADLTASVDGHILRRNGSTLGFGTIATAGIANSAVTFPKIQNIATATILGRNTALAGNIEALTAADVRGILNISDGANNYTHPSQTAVSLNSNLTGATILSNITVTSNTAGHLTGATITTRTLTLSNLGYTGATNANYYIHPSDGSGSIPTALTGANVIASLVINTAGHVTGTTTRLLTLANLGYTGATNANYYAHPNHSGDVTSVADGVTIITAKAVTYSKIQNMTGPKLLLGRITTGAGSIEELSATDIRSIIEDANNRFVADTQIANFTAAYTHSSSVSHAPADAPSNTAFVSHTGDSIKHITAAERSTWNAKSNLAIGTTSTTAFRGDYGDAAYKHITTDGSSHTFIDQDVRKAASPTFNRVTSNTEIVIGGAILSYNATNKALDFNFI